MLSKTIFFGDIFTFNPFYVVELIITMRQDFSGVVEINSNHTITQGIADSIFGWVINPFFYGNAGRFRQIHGFFRFICVRANILQYHLAASSTHISSDFSYSLVNWVGAISSDKFVLTLLTCIFGISLNKKCNTISLLV